MISHVNSREFPTSLFAMKVVFYFVLIIYITFYSFKKAESEFSLLKTLFYTTLVRVLRRRQVIADWMNISQS